MRWKNNRWRIVVLLANQRSVLSFDACSYLRDKCCLSWSLWQLGWLSRSYQRSREGCNCTMLEVVYRCIDIGCRRKRVPVCARTTHTACNSSYFSVSYHGSAITVRHKMVQRWVRFILCLRVPLFIGHPRIRETTPNSVPSSP